MKKYTNRAWRYCKCNNCGAQIMSDPRAINIKCHKCGATVIYDEQVEWEWLNEKDEQGRPVRLDFEGYDEQNCRENAAKYFNCSKEDITNYYIVQQGFLFKKFVICATRPIKYNIPLDATKIVCWRHENRDSIWLAINPKDKTILYPYGLGSKYIKYTGVVDIYEKKDTLATTTMILKIEPIGDITIPFYPGYTDNIKKLVDILYSELPQRKNGFYTHCFFHSNDIENSSNKNSDTLRIKIKSDDFNLAGRMRIWKKDNKLCLCDIVYRNGITFDIDDLKYYRLIGEKYATTQITGGGGGGTSLKGAVVGGVLAGGAGAVIGSRKQVNPISSKTVVHDDQVVLIYNNNMTQCVQINSAIYEILNRLIPEKDYEYVISLNNSTTASNDDILNAVEKLSELYKKDIITKEEFEAKKKDLLNKI